MRRLGEKTITKPRPEYGPFPRIVVELSRPEVVGVWVDGEPTTKIPDVYLIDGDTPYTGSVSVSFLEGDFPHPSWKQLRAGDRVPNLEIRWEKE